MRINVTVRQLHAFLEIADEGNFSKAAARLHVSQPALSRTVRLTEDALGARLFDRNTHAVELTPSGRELLPIARRIVSEFNESMSDLARFTEGRRGRVRVTILPSMAQSILSDGIATFCAAHPDIEFLVTAAPADSILASVERGDMDVAITVQPPPDGHFSFRHLLTDEFVLVCRADDPVLHGVLADSPLSWQVFDRRPYVASTVGSSVRAATDHAFMRRGMTVRPAHETSTVQLAGAMISAGLGVGVLPRIALPLLSQSNLVSRRLESPQETREIGFVTLQGRSLSTASRLFCEHLETLALQMQLD
ncbi:MULTISPECIES: LysR family transcriptional regulator [Polaromonas]|uniref:LysR family transcriptional regulator n=1 Tax=Polaromonas aquatica TaxID=332657 RepID=A0ABW1TSE3_9BURK